MQTKITIERTRNEILEILVVLRCNHVAGSVGVCESIQKSLKTSCQKLDKRILCLVLSTSTKNGVLQNMGNTSGILGY